MGLLMVPNSYNPAIGAGDVSMHALASNHVFTLMAYSKPDDIGHTSLWHFIPTEMVI